MNHPGLTTRSEPAVNSGRVIYKAIQMLVGETCRLVALDESGRWHISKVLSEGNIYEIMIGVMIRNNIDHLYGLL